MKENDKMKTVSLDFMIDKHIGGIGTSERDYFENVLHIVINWSRN